jgi:hypothetical protein
MTIKIVHAATKNKPNGRYCPWMIDCPMEVGDKK